MFVTFFLFLSFRFSFFRFFFISLSPCFFPLCLFFQQSTCVPDKLSMVFFQSISNQPSQSPDLVFPYCHHYFVIELSLNYTIATNTRTRTHTHTHKPIEKWHRGPCSSFSFVLHLRHGILIQIERNWKEKTKKNTQFNRIKRRTKTLGIPSCCNISFHEIPHRVRSREGKKQLNFLSLIRSISAKFERNQQFFFLSLSVGDLVYRRIMMDRTLTTRRDWTEYRIVI